MRLSILFQEYLYKNQSSESNRRSLWLCVSIVSWCLHVRCAPMVMWQKSWLSSCLIPNGLLEYCTSKAQSLIKTYRRLFCTISRQGKRKMHRLFIDLGPWTKEASTENPTSTYPCGNSRASLAICSLSQTWDIFTKMDSLTRTPKRKSYPPISKRHLNITWRQQRRISLELWTTWLLSISTARTTTTPKSVYNTFKKLHKPSMSRVFTILH